MFEEKALEKTMLYNGKILTVYNDKVLLPNGKTSYREYIRHPGAACVVAITPENELLFVEQYRYALQSTLLELPAGKLERGEDPAVCAARELEEETGYTPSKIESLGQILVSPGYSDEVIHLFVANGLVFKGIHNDDDEFTHPVTLSLEDALDKIMHGEITDAKTICGVLKYASLGISK